MAYLSPSLTIMINAAKKAAVGIARDFNELEHLQTSVHNGDSFAHRSYEKAKNILREELSKLKPQYAFVTSKTDSVPANGNYFAIDTINGMVNFAHGNTRFAMSIALVENGNVVCAVIYNPLTDEMYFAEKGTGAFKEGFRSHERLRIAGRKNIEQTLCGISADLTLITKALQITPNINVSGCVALDMAYLAAGKLDLVAVSEAPLNAIAAGMLLIKEAGGYIFGIGETDVRTEDLSKVLQNGDLFATNENLRQKAADLFA